jgi:hypothetical protein
MYVRITRGRFAPATEPEVQRIVDEKIVPALRNLPGFLRYIGGFDRRAGLLCAMTLWDTEEHASFSRDMVMDGIFELMALNVALEVAEIYEITADV